MALELEVVPLAAPVGAEVKGLDAVMRPNSAVVDILKRTMADYGCILLRGQNLDEERHVAFAEALGKTVVPWLHSGELNTVARMRELPGKVIYTGAQPGVFYHVSASRYAENPRQRYMQGLRRLLGRALPTGEPGRRAEPDTRLWHADMTHLQAPIPYVSLHAVEAHEEGDQTWLCNQHLAYEHLDTATKQRVDQLSIKHSYRQLLPNLAPVVHPVVLTHPISQRRGIYGIPGFADDCPLGVSPEEGAQLMAKLTAHLETDAFVYKHSWRTGDLLIWDNRCVLHRRAPRPGGTSRILRRIMAGDDPLIGGQALARCV